MWFPIRLYLRDFFHPRSPLSSTSLVHTIFFSPDYPIAQVKPFEALLAEYESYLWPLAQIFRFVDCKRVLNACQGKILVVAAEKDKLMTVPLMRKMADEYEVAKEKLNGEKPAVEVGYAVVRGSGHHMQNDLMWEDAADIVRNWLEEID
jgi:hypothetical protein